MPTGNPVAELILQNIELTFKSINGEPDYFTTVNPANVKRMDKNLIEVNSFPFIGFVASDTFYDRLPIEKRVSQRISTEMFVEVTIALQTRAATAQTDLENFIRDVHRAWMLDKGKRGLHPINGNELAFDSRLVEAHRYYTNTERGPLSWADMTFEVNYGTKRYELNENQ